MTVVIRKCLYFNECGKEEVYNGRWRLYWNHYKGEIVCRKHYNTLFANSKRTKEILKKSNERRITFLGKGIHLSWKIRKGYCSICPNNIYDNTCLYTQMHHWFYVPIMIWACTEERCPNCHIVETNKYIIKNGLTKGYKKRLKD